MELGMRAQPHRSRWEPKCLTLPSSPGRAGPWMREPGASYGQARRPSVRSSRPRRETNGHLRMDLVVPQPPPVTGGQRPLLGRMLPNFTGRPLQAVPPRGAAADESAGTCGADSPLPSGEGTAIQHRTSADDSNGHPGCQL